MYDANRNRASRRLAALSGLIYASSFLLPVMAEDFLGFQAFLSGLIGLLILVPIWLANPLLWIGWGLLSRGKPKGAAICGWFATPLALLTLVYDFDIQFGFKSIGYWAWTASMALLLLAGMMGAPEPYDVEEEFQKSIDDPIECRSCGERFRRSFDITACPMCGESVDQSR